MFICFCLKNNDNNNYYLLEIFYQNETKKKSKYSLKRILSFYSTNRQKTKYIFDMERTSIKKTLSIFNYNNYNCLTAFNIKKKSIIRFVVLFTEYCGTSIITTFDGKTAALFDINQPNNLHKLKP